MKIGRPAPPSNRRLAGVRAAWALPFRIVLVGAVAVALTGLHIITRAPCPPSYVRLIDFSSPLLGLSVAVTGAGLASVYWRKRLPAPVEVLLQAFGLLASLGGAVHLLLLRDTCWSFGLAATAG